MAATLVTVWFAFEDSKRFMPAVGSDRGLIRSSPPQE